MLTFCISIPVLNEERRLKVGVEKLIHFLEANKFLYRIEIISNGSTDRTVDIGVQLTKSFSQVTFIHLDSPGVGRALKNSWGQAVEDIVGYVDVDLSVDLNHLLSVRDSFQRDPKLHLVNGNRLLPDSLVGGRRLLRRILSRILNLLIFIFLGARAGDAMCGFKFIRRDQYRALQKAAKMRDDWFFNAELVIRSIWAQYNIRQLPVRFTESHDSRVKILKVSFRFLSAILVLMGHRWRRRSNEG